MSDQGRPPRQEERPLAFDTGRESRGAPRGRGRAPIALIASMAVLLALVAVVALYYRSGVRKEGEAPPVVGAPVDSFRNAAPSGAAASDEEAGLRIYSDEDAVPASGAAAPTFSPQTEEPETRPAATPPPAKAELPPPPPGAPAAVTPQPAAAAPTPLKPKVAASTPTPTAKPQPTKAAPSKAKPDAIDNLLAENAAKNPVNAAPPPAKPAPKPAATPVKPTPAPPATTTAPATSGGAGIVQIGAVSSTALAEKAWNGVASSYPGDMAGKGKHVEPVQTGGATLYRVQITGFGSKAAAATFCGKLKAAGKTCFAR